jgi:hypothetical protein
MQFYNQDAFAALQQKLLPFASYGSEQAWTFGQNIAGGQTTNGGGPGMYGYYQASNMNSTSSWHNPWG